MIADLPYEWPNWIARWFHKVDVPPAVLHETKDVVWKPATDLERSVFAAMVLAGRPVSNGELARFMGVSPGEASKRVKALQGVIRKERIGREVRLSLPHYH
jgi:hypothetical protein